MAKKKNYGADVPNGGVPMEEGTQQELLPETSVEPIVTTVEDEEVAEVSEVVEPPKIDYKEYAQEVAGRMVNNDPRTPYLELISNLGSFLICYSDILESIDGEELTPQEHGKAVREAVKDSAYMRTVGCDVFESFLKVGHQNIYHRGDGAPEFNYISQILSELAEGKFEIAEIQFRQLFNMFCDVDRDEALYEYNEGN